MTKLEFILSLHDRLSGLPQDDIEERLNFYLELIEDGMEEGLAEEEAVRAIGSVDEIVDQIIADIPFAKIAKEKIKPKRRLKVWEIILLVLGSPVWLSLLLAAFAVILALYVSLWAVIISLWAVFVALAGCTIGSVMAGIILMLQGNGPGGIAMVAAAFVCAGLSVFMFYGCKAVTKGILVLTKKTAACVKRCFIKKEEP